MMRGLRLLGVPMAIYLCSALVYVAVGGERTWRPSPNNHYAHLAYSWLSGELHAVGRDFAGLDDLACFDVERKGPCPSGMVRPSPEPTPRYRWYISFPPFPAALLLPAVAIFGVDIPDRLFWALFAGLGPALLFLLLRFLSKEGLSARRPWENLLLTTLFAFGSVYFFVAVQGTVWYAAHVTACALMALYLLWSIGARRPALAGLALGLLFLTRPTTLFLGVFFVLEAMRISRRRVDPAGSEVLARIGHQTPQTSLALENSQTSSNLENTGCISCDPKKPQNSRHLRDLHGFGDRCGLVWVRVWRYLRTIAWGDVLKRVAIMSVPVLALGLLAAWHNQARFDDPFEFGHRFLQVRWRPRIERWGLFNYHYVARNLAVMWTSMPWLSAHEPFIKVSLHGLALWVTTPGLLLCLWPKRTGPLTVALFAAVVPVAVLNLMYQNSGWVQFGYRFALDYMTLLFVLLAIGGRRFGPGFHVLTLYAIAINALGAATFDRNPRFYDNDFTQKTLFQPD